MEFKKPQNCLVVQRNPGTTDRTVKIWEGLSDSIFGWAPDTRISPVFAVADTAAEGARLPLEFRGNYCLTFLGPVHPARAIEQLTAKDYAWLTLGLFNVVVAQRDLKRRNKLLAWAKANQVPTESWTLRNGVIGDTTAHGVATASDKAWRKSVTSLSKQSLVPELAEAAREYCPTIACAFSRAWQLPTDELRKKLEELHEYARAEFTAEDEDFNPRLSQLLLLNNGLSRFVSQTFTGCAPILDTDGNLRGNGLLGIGVPSLGLWALCHFIERELGESRIFERFVALEKEPAGERLAKLEAADPFWDQDHLASAKLGKPSTLAAQTPLLPHFSARDGFKSTLTTISVPQAAVYGCNSLRWSLLTVTHESSHVVVRPILAYLLPDFDDREAVATALAQANLDYKPGNLLEEIRHFVYTTVMQMDIEGSEYKTDVPYNAEMFSDALQRNAHEIEEILVHIFDFMYFYGRDPQRYVRGIWLSWGTVPNLAGRIRDYVVRTLCAVSAVNVKRGVEGLDIARDIVLSVLEKMLNEDVSQQYIRSARDLLKEHWKTELRSRLIARMPLIKVGRTFLFSKSIAHRLRGDPYIVGDESQTQGYALKPGKLDLSSIRNPLHFIEQYTKGKEPSSHMSAWMYYVLAFCVESDKPSL